MTKIESDTITIPMRSDMWRDYDMGRLHIVVLPLTHRWLRTECGALRHEGCPYRVSTSCRPCYNRGVYKCHPFTIAALRPRNNMEPVAEFRIKDIHIDEYGQEKEGKIKITLGEKH